MATTLTASIQIATSPSAISGMFGTDTDTGNSTSNLIQQLAFAANSNSVMFTLNFNAAGVQALFVVASQNCTVNTNNANAPTNSVSLVAGIPLYWSRSAGYFAQPFNANTNAGFLSCNAATILNMLVLTS